MNGVRFAPSPTGRFHAGNLRTAWIAAEWARALGIPFVVRFEDIDTPRVVKGAAETQLKDMLALGLKPDIVQTQSEFRPRHLALFEKAAAAGQLYPCDCSRKDVRAKIQSAPNDGGSPVYSGRCRNRERKDLNPTVSLAWRFRGRDASGAQDFIVARTVADDPNSFVPAYHWACAIDDFDGRFDLLVRSSDLASAAAVQRQIQDWLGHLEGEKHRPAIFHTALVVQDGGARLEKRTRGVTLPELETKFSAAEILARFRTSFDSTILARRPFSGEIFAEAPVRLTLSQLGLA